MKSYYRDEPLGLGEQVRITVYGTEVRIVAKAATSWPERIKRQGYKPSIEGMYVVIFEVSREEFRLQIPEALSQVKARMRDRQATTPPRHKATPPLPTQGQEAP